MPLLFEMLAAGGLLLAVDQYSKRLVTRHLRDRTFSIGRVLVLRRVLNNKPIYRQRAARAGLVIAWLAVLASALVACMFGGFHTHVGALAIGFAVGGAAGNLVDIVCRRQILDFIDLSWWPVFNLADVAITGGVVLAFWSRA